MGLLLSGKNPAAYKTAERSTFTATAGQTTFTVPVGYNVGDIDVFLNGLKLVEGDDFFATNGTTVVLASGANLGDSLSVVCYYNFLNSSSYTKAESDNRYVLPNGQIPMTSYLRTPNYGISSTSDSLSASLEASAFAGEQGVGIKAFGRSVASTGGDILYTADSRGAGGRHRFGYWNGSSFNSTMTIDSIGRLTLPNQPAFSVRGVSNTTSDGSNRLLSWSTVDFNVGNNFNTSTNRFTAPYTGKYAIGYHLFTSGTTYRRLSTLSINGSSYQEITHETTTDTYSSLSYFTILNLNANEYVNVTSTAALLSGSLYHSFSGYFLG